MKDVTRDELKHILQKATQHARNKAKAAGTSLIYEEDGKMIREYAYGVKKQVVRDEQGRRSEIEFDR
ncbi:hypothetical protein [Paenibacillus lutrae]|uniref:Uncharacterized protein n=1 Tax=Paenibacillus lutrae TaxID=2078573 RepID=A0A7X3K1F9_9BACL|nr:hypothetical protein [Paenibacillus lutrae]MVP02092.1 hypothetical protein [Paenibacillus lutrae]